MVCVYIICLIEQLSSVYKHDVNRFTFIRIKEKVGERERENSVKMERIDLYKKGKVRKSLEIGSPFDVNK